MFHISEFLNAFESLFYNTSNINTVSFKIFLFRIFIFTSDKMYTKYTCKLAYRDLLNNRLYQIKQLYQHIKEGGFQVFFFFLIRPNWQEGKTKKLYFLDKSFEVNEMLQGSWWIELQWWSLHFVDEMVHSLKSLWLYQASFICNFQWKQLDSLASYKKG